MIWHIFKKDWKLEWKLAALVSAVQFACAGALIKLGPIPNSRSLYSLWQLLLLATIAGIPFLIVAVDAINFGRTSFPLTSQVESLSMAVSYRPTSVPSGPLMRWSSS